MKKLPEKLPQRGLIAVSATLLYFVFFLLAAPAPASADVTVKQTNQGKGLGMSAHVSSTTYIKGDKMRIDDRMGNRTESTIFDLGAQKAYFFSSERKQADVWNMQAFAHEISKTVDQSSVQASIKPNGRTKQLAGHIADGYDVDVSVQATTPGSNSPLMVTLVGSLWIVKGAPGTADFDHFYQTAADKGWIFNNPRAAKAQPGQAKAMAEMYRKVAELGGIPYETDLQIHVRGRGMMGALLARLGNVTSSTMVESIDTGALTGDLFSPPPGYKLNLRH